MSSESFQKAIHLIDDANRQDPHSERFEGKDVPKEWLYSVRMSEWLEKLKSEASEELRLAVRAQHLKRWTIPRETYPRDRAGYLKWRTELKNFHAREAAALLKEAGYASDFCERVSFLIRKEALTSDPETRLLEDAACLVFLEFYFEAFASEHEKEKVTAILRKTWAKMSDSGRREALRLNFSESTRKLVDEALAR